jgi:hypothetical protein
MMSGWKERLRTFDDLAPHESVYARATQGSRHDVPDGPSGRKRLVAGVVAFAVFGAAALFAWQAFRPSDGQDPPVADRGGTPSATPAVSPDAVAVTCTADGTVVPPTADVTPQGPRFTIDNQSGAAQVLIAGVSGDAQQYAANIDLSQRTTNTFDIPPGDYVVGCFQDEVQGPGGAQAWQDLPGMVPVTIHDPEGTYASPMITCEGQHADTSSGLAEVPTGSTPEDAVRAATDGIEDSDVIEAAGYPGNQGHLGLGNQMFQLRLVREGATVAAFMVTSVAEGDPFHVDVIACKGTGIEARHPSGSSPTPVGG